MYSKLRWFTFTEKETAFGIISILFLLSFNVCMFAVFLFFLFSGT